MGAEIESAALPAAAAVALRLPGPHAMNSLLAGGDDYELCFTAAPDRRDAVLAAGVTAGVPVSRIGRIVAEPGLRILRPDGGRLDLEVTGFDHFAR